MIVLSSGPIISFKPDSDEKLVNASTRAKDSSTSILASGDGATTSDDTLSPELVEFIVCVTLVDTELDGRISTLVDSELVNIMLPGFEFVVEGEDVEEATYSFP